MSVPRSLLGQFLAPSTVSIFLQPPGVGFVPLLLSQVSIPSPNKVSLNLAETETFERRYTIPRNPVERLTGQNRVKEPDTLTLTGMLSAHPIFSPLQSAGLARLDKRELLKLRTLLETSQSFIVTPERPYKDMSCTYYQETFDENTGDGVRLTLRFEELRIALPGFIDQAFDPDALAIGAASVSALGPQTAGGVPDPGGF